MQGKHKLPEPDVFLIEMAKTENMQDAIHTLIFLREAGKEVSELQAYFQTLSNVAQRLRDDEGVKFILRTTLKLGNLTNHAYARHKRPTWQGASTADGFRIDGLTRLRDVKSPIDGRFTLLHFLVEVCVEYASMQLEDDGVPLTEPTSRDGKAKLFETLVKDNWLLDPCSRYTDLRDVRAQPFHDVMARVVLFVRRCAQLLRRHTASDQADGFNEKVYGRVKDASRMARRVVVGIASAMLSWQQTSQYFAEETADETVHVAPSESATLDELSAWLGRVCDAWDPSKTPSVRKPEEFVSIFDTFFGMFQEAVEAAVTKMHQELRRAALKQPHQ